MMPPLLHATSYKPVTYDWLFLFLSIAQFGFRRAGRLFRRVGNVATRRDEESSGRERNIEHRRIKRSFLPFSLIAESISPLNAVGLRRPDSNFRLL